MFRYMTTQAKSLLPAVFGLVILVMTPLVSKDAHAALSTDLQSLVTQGNNINTQLSAMSLTTDNSCTELGTAVASVEVFITAIESVSNNISTPMSVDVDSLNALDDLAAITIGMSGALPTLSADVSSINLISDMADIQATMDAMLKLSDEIGIMADRILEMGDKILVMSDNIGDMADRILITQQIQSTNMAMTQSFILATQENMVALASTIDSSVYTLPMNTLIATASTLISDMNSSSLTETNMATELADFENRISLYMDAVVSLSNSVNTNSSFAAHFINSDTLTMLGDLSVANAGLATALNNYAQAVHTLAPTTNITILDDSVNSMLRLALDISVMSSRIVEMGDKINVMADNIGLMAFNIVATQTLQQQNLELTVANLSAAQTTTVSVIAAYGL